MIKIEIPGYAEFQFHHLVLDVNGTIAKDGKLLEGVADLLKELRAKLDIHLITADTHGSQQEIDRLLDLTAVLIPSQNQVKAKLDYIEGLGADKVFAVGNGANDARMLERCTETLLKAKVVVPDVGAALELLLYPNRLAATLRR
jgi:soluble P-type ATPase